MTEPNLPADDDAPGPEVAPDSTSTPDVASAVGAVSLRALAGITVAVAIGAAAVTALLVNVFERKSEARVPFVRLVEVGEHHEDWFGIWSGGQFFPIIPSKDLPA